LNKMLQHQLQHR